MLSNVPGVSLNVGKRRKNTGVFHTDKALMEKNASINIFKMHLINRLQINDIKEHSAAELFTIPNRQRSLKTDKSNLLPESKVNNESCQ